MPKGIHFVFQNSEIDKIFDMDEALSWAHAFLKKDCYTLEHVLQAHRYVCDWSRSTTCTRALDSVE
jgi:hypothetical protein